jgi:uncharacterized membrane protein YphA (DoxX/SURF4 family)
MATGVIRWLDALAEGVPRWPLALMRIYAGLVLWGAAMNQLSDAAATPPYPHRESLLVGLELFAAVALAFGIATRLSALLGVAIVMRYIFSTHVTAAVFVSPGPITALMMALVTVGLGRSGRVWGLDALFARRWPRNPLW